MIYKTYSVGGELYHHGILGQRWGKRNGPPYPLDGSDHSQSEKKAGWRKSLSGGKESTSKKKKKKEGLVVDAMTGELKNNKALKEARIRKYRMENDYLLKPILDKIDKKKESKDHLVEDLNKFEKDRRAEKLHKQYEELMKEFGKEMNESTGTYLKARDKALSWYKKNDPKGLQRMLNEVGGKEEDLDSAHDFRKLVEGYESEIKSGNDRKKEKIDKAIDKADNKKKEKSYYTISEIEKKYIDRNEDISSDEYRRLAEYMMKTEEKRNPGFEKWLVENDHDLAWDPKSHDKYVDMYKRRR